MVYTCTKALEFYNINSELTCSDLISEQNFQHFEQPSFLTKHYLHGTSNPFPCFLLPRRTKGELEEDEGDFEENKVVLEDC